MYPRFEGKKEPTKMVEVNGKFYKRDSDVTVEDIERLVEAKRVEQGVALWSEIRVKPTE